MPAVPALFCSKAILGDTATLIVMSSVPPIIACSIDRLTAVVKPAKSETPLIPITVAVPAAGATLLSNVKVTGWLPDPSSIVNVSALVGLVESKIINAVA